MKDIKQVNNPYHDDKVIDACSIFGVMDTSGKKFSGEGVIRAIANMHVRGRCHQGYRQYACPGQWLGWGICYLRIISRIC